MKTDSIQSRQTLVLLLTLLACALLAESVARWGVPRISKVESRIVGEAAAVAREMQDGDHKVLLIGNSLLEASVQPAELRAAFVGSGWQPLRYAVEATSYYDMWFGLRHLFATGRRPQAVVLMLSPKQFVANGIRGAYSMQRLIGLSDAWEVGRLSGAHPTDRVGYQIANLSAYYGLRTEIRKVALQRVVPGVEQVTELVVKHERATRRGVSSVPEPGVIEGRLTALTQLCKQYQVRCLLAVPIEMEPVLWESDLIAKADAMGFGTATLRPAQRYDATDFQADRYHMAEAGAKKYGPELSGRLIGLLNAR